MNFVNNSLVKFLDEATRHELVRCNQKRIQKKWKKANVKISKELRDIIHGYVVSDGYVKKEGNLQVTHGPQQAKFVEWMYNKLKDFRSDAPISDVSYDDKRFKGKKTVSKRFYSNRLLIGFRNMWYKPLVDQNGQPILNSKGQPTYRKALPKSFNAFFTPTTIALWYASDGTRVPDALGARIEVTSLTPDERLRVKNLFKTKFDIDVSITKAGVSTAGTPQFNISINAKNYPKFHAIITQLDLIPTLFPYKLHKCP